MGKALIIKGADFSAVAVDTIDIEVITPTISCTIAGQVTLSQSGGDDIYYTTDGSTPTTASTKYTAPFTVQPNTTVKAVAYNGSNYSDVASYFYDGTLQAPVISISGFGVVIITGPAGSTIYYTTDGSTPTSASTQYSSPFQTTNDTVIKAIAAAGSITSDVTSVTASGIVEDVTFGKKIVETGNWGITDDEDYCISPFVAFDNTKSLTWNWGQSISGTPFGETFFQSNKTTKTNTGWNARAADGVQRTVTSFGNYAAYVRCTFIIGVPGYLEQDGVKLYEYDGHANPNA